MFETETRTPGKDPGPALFVSIDGAARGNPGPAAIGVVITDAEGRRRVEISKTIGRRTNNQAEYEALLEALQALRKLAPQRAVIRTDSELLYHQMQGSYRIRNSELARLNFKAQVLRRTLTGIAFELIPRTENKAADKLANKALDAKAAARGERKERARVR